MRSTYPKLMVSVFLGMLFSLFFLSLVLYSIGVLRISSVSDEKKRDSVYSSDFHRVVEQGSELARCAIYRLNDHVDKIDSNCSEGFLRDNRKELHLLFDVIEKQKSEHFLINLIYFLLFCCLFVQSSLFFGSFFFVVEKTHFFFSDWAINSAPLLGVLGTIASFAVLVSATRYEDMKDLFSASFFDAAITTLVGGFVYIVNLLMAVRLNSLFKG